MPLTAKAKQLSFEVLSSDHINFTIAIRQCDSNLITTVGTFGYQLCVLNILRTIQGKLADSGHWPSINYSPPFAQGTTKRLTPYLFHWYPSRWLSF